MNTKFQIDGFLKFAEEDNYNEGCDPDTTTTSTVDVSFSGKTAEEAVQAAAEFLGVDSDGIERNACDEDGRIDFSLMECADGTSPSKGEIAAWKKGKMKLWACTYTGTLEKVETVKA